MYFVRITHSHNYLHVIENYQSTLEYGFSELHPLGKLCSSFCSKELVEKCNLFIKRLWDKLGHFQC